MHQAESDYHPQRAVLRRQMAFILSSPSKRRILPSPRLQHRGPPDCPSRHKFRNPAHQSNRQQHHNRPTLRDRPHPSLLLGQTHLKPHSAAPAFRYRWLPSRASVLRHRYRKVGPQSGRRSSNRNGRVPLQRPRPRTATAASLCRLPPPPALTTLPPPPAGLWSPPTPQPTFKPRESAARRTDNSPPTLPPLSPGRQRSGLPRPRRSRRRARPLQRPPKLRRVRPTQ
jgi:hypothetical protein